MNIYSSFKQSIRAALMALWIVLTSAVIVMSADSGPVPAANTLAQDGQMRITKSDRCPVCAMFPVRYPQSAAALTLISGETYYFCSNGCLLRAWLRPAVYVGKNKADIDRLVVQDYFSGKSIDGRTATWVAGSDVIGPMGPAIVALDDDTHLTTFKKRHGGSTIFSLDQLDDELWKQISQRVLPTPNTD